MHTAKYANLRILQLAHHFYNCRALFYPAIIKNVERKFCNQKRVLRLSSQVISLSENYKKNGKKIKKYFFLGILTSKQMIPATLFSYSEQENK